MSIHSALAVMLCLFVLAGHTGAREKRIQYKKQHRPVMAQLGRGEFTDALKALAELERQFPGDAETQFCLALAHSGRGEGEAALGYARRAVSLGLPVERLVAGPRSLNKALLMAQGFGELAGKGNARLVHGPMLGDLGTTSVKIWARAGRECELKAVIEGVSADAVNVSAANDYTAVIELTRLEPDTFYHYQIFQDEQPVDVGHETSFRTLPSDGGKKIKVVFGGGAGFTPSFERMWNTIASHKPDALFMLGDNVYIDQPEVREVGQYCYYRRQSRPEWRRLTASVPVYAIWDDHDFATNDSHGGAAVDIPAWKPRVWGEFTRQWPNPEYGGAGRQPGCYFTFGFGRRVEFFFLDTRYYREPAAREMLGPVQLAWLKEQLLGSRAAFKVICSSVPMTPKVKPGSLDTWDGYPGEREEIFRFIAEKKIGGVFVLAADRHRSDAWKTLRPGRAYPIYEFMSSRLTNIHAHKVIEGCLFGYNAKPSFGEVTFDFTGQDPAAQYSAYSIDNEKVGSVKITLSQLQVR
ncbi:MAG: alkaline phosphatase D family protein [Verrucomicrobiales bacterium]|nr:alkaline phosphatase D family protein [Verrucomicrobiales bacterium]